MAILQLKRVYEPIDKTDGYRVLVDRLWPRGISKEDLHIDLWLKEIAPSDHLRKWFGHDPAKFEEFAHKYRDELQVNPALFKLRDIVSQNATVTLLYAAHDTEHNQAVVLQQLLSKKPDS
jgi:uncharacterized protein YeaO (DUF488 family)